jgi:hypothetical protein
MNKKKKRLTIEILVLLAIFFTVFLAKAFVILPSGEFSLEGILHDDFVMLVGQLTAIAAIVIIILHVFRI